MLSAFRVQSPAFAFGRALLEAGYTTMSETRPTTRGVAKLEALAAETTSPVRADAVGEGQSADLRFEGIDHGTLGAFRDGAVRRR